MGKSDPFAVVTMRGDNANNKPVVVGQTDVYVVCLADRIILLLYAQVLLLRMSVVCVVVSPNGRR